MTRLARRLSTQDAGFLYVERPTAPMHAASVYVYAGDLSLADVIAATEERLHLVPRYRQKVVFPPFGVAHPTWEDDPAFDIRAHIVEAAAPAPGDDRALAEMAARYLLPPMDRGRPLWKTVVVRGLADGTTATIALTHHAMIDGVSGVDLLLVLHDLTPDAPPPPVPEPWRPQPLPDPLALLQDAVRDSLVQAAERWTETTFERYRPQETAARARQLTEAMTAMMPQLARPAPRTRFNGPVSDRRAMAYATFPFAAVRAIRAALGGTVNDVVLTIEAGALGRYLRGHGERVEGLELRAMCPVSMRAAEGHGQLGNQVSMMLAPLYVGIDDPVARHNAERAAMERLKAQGQAAALYAMTNQGDQTPAWQQMLAGQAEAPNTMYNTVSSNMPGPQVPLYMKGHRLLRTFGGAMLSPNIGLFFAIISYNQTLTINVTVDPAQIPDPWTLADCLHESFAELRDAADRDAAASGEPALAGIGATGRGSRRATEAATT